MVGPQLTELAIYQSFIVSFYDMQDPFKVFQSFELRIQKFKVKSVTRPNFSLFWKVLLARQLLSFTKPLYLSLFWRNLLISSKTEVLPEQSFCSHYFPKFSSLNKYFYHVVMHVSHFLVFLLQQFLTKCILIIMHGFVMPKEQ